MTEEEYYNNIDIDNEDIEGLADILENDDDSDLDDIDTKPNRKNKNNQKEEIIEELQEYDEIEKVPSKEELIHKDNLIDYIETCKQEFPDKLKFIKGDLNNLSINELEAIKTKINKRVLNSTFYKSIDNMVELGHMGYEMTLNSVMKDQFKGLADMLNENQIIKDCWKLLAIEKGMMHFKDPGTVLMMNYAFMTATCYGLNKSGLNPAKITTKINKDKLNKDLNDID